MGRTVKRKTPLMLRSYLGAPAWHIPAALRILVPSNRASEGISLSCAVDNLSKLPGAAWNTKKEDTFNYYAIEVII